MTGTDWIGCAGVAILLLAFYLNIRGIIKRDSTAYLGLNIVGAGLACLESIMLEFWPFIILEGCWMVVSVIELVQLLRRRG